MLMRRSTAPITPSRTPQRKSNRPRWLSRASRSTATLLLAGLLTGGIAAAQPGMAGAAGQGSCLGTVRVTPSPVHIGRTLTFSGSHFACKDPAGKLFPSVEAFLYQPHLGFTSFTLKVAPNGTYHQRAIMPAKLLAESTLTSGSQRMVAARPGQYYVSLRLFDVYLPPPSQADARVTVVR